MNNIGIYKIISPSNKIYIGETINFQQRFKKYLNLSCKGQQKLYNSFIKYGVENHIFEVIEICEIENLMSRERYWQDYYDVLSDKGMNLKLTSSFDKKQQFSKETIDKRKNTLKERGGLYGERNPMYGKKHSECTKDKIRKKQTGKYNGKNNPMYGKFGKDHPAYGNKLSSETLDHMRKINMYGGNPNSKIVIDLETGIFYESASEISDLLNINKFTFRARLNGNLKNNTNYKYC